MFNNKKSKLVLFALLLVFFIGASFVLAHTSFAEQPLEITYPEIQGFAPTTTKTILPDYILYVFQFSLFIAAIIAFGSFVYGGFRYLFSGTSASIKKDARSQIAAGMLGLIILLSSYIILNTINPQLVVLKSPLPTTGEPPFFPSAALQKPQPATYLGIAAGAVITNLWGEKHSLPYKSAECYNFDPNGDADEFLPDNDRLDCIQKLSKAIKIKAEKLKEHIEELQKFYDCKFCCADCCENTPCAWTEEEEVWTWKNCTPYDCCEGQGIVKRSHIDDRYSECKFSNCCKFFETCPCKKCKECICIRPDNECCNPDNPIKHYEDPLIKDDLIPKIKQAKHELNLKLGPFGLIDELPKSENIDALLSNEDTKNLIKRILIGAPIDEEKLKRILKIKEVMEELVRDYWDLLLADENLSEIISSLSDPINKEKLTWVLRYNENLKKIIESKDYLGALLVGEDTRLKKLLSKKEVIQILIEDKNDLSELCQHSNIKEIFKKIMRMEQESEWLDFIAVIPETAINLKLAYEFERDLLWVTEVADLMRTCKIDPVSADQIRVPEEYLPNMERVIMPKWENIEKEILGGPDPATFYCPKQLW
ncbi:hypothetical protein KAU40_01800 [Candidatus Parcubacteria bacterium]|nr:hypothetical protein [Candidatus Parcubacteria bacterium]